MFTDAERAQMLNESPLWVAAAATLAERGIQVDTHSSTGTDVADDGVVTLVASGEQERRHVLLKNRLTSEYVAALGATHSNNRVLVVTGYLSPAIAVSLRRLGMNYVDTAGNMYLTGDRLLIDVEGKKPPKDRVDRGKPMRAFQASGLKIIFCLLCEPALASWTYREIADASGSSLGSVQTVFAELIQSNVIEVDGSRRRLHSVRWLFDRWVEAYTLNLLSRLDLGRYATDDISKVLSREDRLTKLGAQLGGESAVSKLTGFLQPSSATIYVSQVPSALLGELRLRRDGNEGNVNFRQRFWTLSHLVRDLTVPSPLVYADLVASGDPRQIEAAQDLRASDALLRSLDRR